MADVWQPSASTALAAPCGEVDVLAMVCSGSPASSILRLRAASANRSSFRALQGLIMRGM
jgi:hypothetical protein